MNLVPIGGLRNRRRQVAVRDLGNVSDEICQPLLHAVHGVLHLLVIALAGNLYLLPQISATDHGEDTIAFADRQQDRVEHLVDPGYDIRVSAAELIGLSAFGEFAVAGSYGQPGEFLDQSLDVFHRGNQRGHQFIVLGSASYCFVSWE